VVKVAGKPETKIIEDTVVEDSLLDVMERMEGLVPEYSYSGISEIVRTDREIRDVLVSEVKKIKDYLFHVVQVSYELHRDRLSEVAERAWDDVDTLVDRIENSKTSSLAGSKTHCNECKKRIEGDLGNIVRRDRELVLTVRDMKRLVHMLYWSLLRKGDERKFIKNLDKIKKYRDEINRLLDERERSIVGG
jgi:hypothetical protein